MVAGPTDPRQLPEIARSAKQRRPGLPALLLEQPFRLHHHDHPFGDRGSSCGVRVFALHLPGPELSVLRGLASQHVPSGDLSRAALHSDARDRAREYAWVARPHLPHIRPAAGNLAPQGLLRQHPGAARAGGAHRWGDAIPGLFPDRDAALGARNHRHRDLFLHRRVERVHLRLHLSLQERAVDTPGRHPALLLRKYHGLSGPDGGQLHDERARRDPVPRPSEILRTGAYGRRSQALGELPVAHVVLKDLVKTYGGFKAVNNVSLTVNDGEFVALVGPSGCGKTTTLNLVAGLIPITSGDIVIGDRVVNDLDPKDRDIAMVFQNYALYPQKSVYKNLAFPLQMRKLPRDEIDKKVREAARVLDMTQLLERKPRELSGGQQQRVALGRALVRDPAVFLMDEPLSNLDAKLRVQMRSEIKRFHQDLKATIIYVTHDQLEAVTMADRMAVMNGGYLQQYDSPAQVFAHPVNMFVASFVGSPAMSLVPLEASTAGGNTVLTSAEGWRLELSPTNTRKVERATTRKVVLGARHSTIKLHKSAIPGSIPAKAYTVEPTGDVTFVQAFLSGAIVNVSVPPTIAVEPDEQIWLEFDQERMHLFDGETEMALKAN
ncbi:sugar ABC transporter, ATP-binding protein [Rhizobium etli CNPAF512]|nr:sugar ABC transporter, ATP-binding protein [Rhizobium etli CNPAF512]